MTGHGIAVVALFVPEPGRSFDLPKTLVICECGQFVKFFDGPTTLERINQLADEHRPGAVAELERDQATEDPRHPGHDCAEGCCVVVGRQCVGGECWRDRGDQGTEPP